MSNKSLSMELAVSCPPAPFPIIISSPANSETNLTEFSAPSTAIGSVLSNLIGFTHGFSFSVSPILATNFIILFSFFASTMSSDVMFVIHSISRSLRVISFPRRKFAIITNFAAASDPFMSNFGSASA